MHAAHKGVHAKKHDARVNIARNNFDYVIPTCVCMHVCTASTAWFLYQSLIKEPIKRDGHAVSV